MKINKFEELQIWKKARELTKSIYRTVSSSKFAKDWALKDQITRAAISIMSNIAEGFDGGSKAEFARFLSMSRRSISEVQSQMYIALDQAYVMQGEFNAIYKESDEIRRMINSFIKYLKGLN